MRVSSVSLADVSTKLVHLSHARLPETNLYCDGTRHLDPETPHGQSPHAPPVYVRCGIVAHRFLAAAAALLALSAAALAPAAAAFLPAAFLAALLAAALLAAALVAAALIAALFAATL